ncbi:hypothetical protein C8R41DRAFT_844818 [Lentinula lateritia]|uniref:Uncharacterized protein n=1 Tax=Lentinula lateritia TaxID=40482 RepID=A0ABQ8VCD5_9AGAR|nr:hypothetical protein C8R41DRAFT_844818 [Lentinula lateritia]
MVSYPYSWSFIRHRDTMASNTSIPPYDNMFLIGIWIQTALYGIKFVLCFTLLTMQRLI